MTFITSVLAELANKRPVFHSEKDFQHTLAWEIHQRWERCSIRMEFKPPYLVSRVYLDIWAADKDAILPIELKYKTRRLRVKIGNEPFDLLDQSAQDTGRYDFLKDIQRLEQIVSGRSDIVSYAIFLTNDSAYWRPPRDSQTVDASFRIHQGRILAGELRWGSGASKGTMKTREEPIFIKGVYNLDWQNYSNPSEEPYGKFKYLLVEVSSGHGV